MTHKAGRAGLALLAALLLLPMAAGLAAAAPSVSPQGYTSGGSFTPVSDGGNVPVGAQLKVRVWGDLYHCDPMRVTWGDGNSSTVNYGGSFAKDFTHAYSTPGTYRITATDCSGSDTATIHVGLGGGLGLLDPDGVAFIPGIIGLVLGLIGLGLALGRPPGLARLRAQAPAPGGPAARPRLRPGCPPSMAEHLGSLWDIPPGAARQQPWIEIVPGEPTDVLQKMTCRAGHGGTLRYTALGWYCLDQNCPLRR